MTRSHRPSLPPLHARAELSRESVFARMSALSARHGAVNLGQGFPSDAPPDFLIRAAREAVGALDQYTPPAGYPPLRAALAHDLSTPALQLDAADVVVAAGATEALGVTAQLLYGAGDELLFFEPAYDIYAPQARLAGAVPVGVPLLLEGGRWRADLDLLTRAVTPRTRAILINSPHNPSGHVFSRAELEGVVALAREHNLWLIADEVYDELYYGEAPTPLRTLAPERTFTAGSAGKRLEATGWRVGWVVCPPARHAPALAPTLAGLRQWSSFCTVSPLSAAVAAALPQARASGFYAGLRARYAGRLDQLSGGLERLGLQVVRPDGSYFLNLLWPGVSAERLVEEAGVATIPGAAFYEQGAVPDGLLRLAFCKSETEIGEALHRLERFLGAG